MAAQEIGGLERPGAEPASSTWPGCPLLTATMKLCELCFRPNLTLSIAMPMGHPLLISCSPVQAVSTNKACVLAPIYSWALSSSQQQQLSPPCDLLSLSPSHAAIKPVLGFTVNMEDLHRHWDLLRWSLRLQLCLFSSCGFHFLSLELTLEIRQKKTFFFSVLRMQIVLPTPLHSGKDSSNCSLRSKYSLIPYCRQSQYVLIRTTFSTCNNKLFRDWTVCHPPVPVCNLESTSWQVKLLPWISPLAKKGD